MKVCKSIHDISIIQYHTLTLKHTDWTAVERDVVVDIDLETKVLKVKTDSKVGSNDYLSFQLYDAVGEYAGGLDIQFKSPPEYYIWWCKATSNNIFPTDLPQVRDRVWKITLTRTSGIRLVIDCNDENILDHQISDSTCEESTWATYWSRIVKGIKFLSRDKASHFFSSQRRFSPGNFKILNLF